MFVSGWFKVTELATFGSQRVRPAGARPTATYFTHFSPVGPRRRGTRDCRKVSRLRLAVPHQVVAEPPCLHAHERFSQGSPCGSIDVLLGDIDPDERSDGLVAVDQEVLYKGEQTSQVVGGLLLERRSSEAWGHDVPPHTL